MLKIRVEKDKLLVSFSFNLQILAIIKEFPNRFFNTVTQDWEIPLVCYDKLLRKLDDNNFKYTVYGEAPTVENQASFDYSSILNSDLFIHQLNFLNWAEDRNLIFLGDEQGLGKSIQALTLAAKREKERGYAHCLIVVGVNGLRYNWKEEVQTHIKDLNCCILGEREITRGANKGKSRNGTVNERLEDLLNIPDEFYWITNIETFRNKEFAKVVENYCKRDIISMVIIDECHRCKAPTAVQSKGFLKTIPCKCKLALTGTPLLNSPLDIFIIIKWLEQETHTWTQFKDHHVIYDKFGQLIVGYRYMNEIKDKLDNVMIRRKKEEVLNLPPKINSNEYIEMTPRQALVYDEIISDIRNNIDKIILHPHPLSQLIRLRQCTGHTSLLSSTIQESAKFTRLHEMIEEIVDNGGKVVIYDNFKEIIKLLIPEISKYNSLIITGDTPTDERQNYVNLFQNDDKHKIMCGTIKALGTGYTLTRAQDVIFLNDPWNRATKEQAEDRCHRIGTKGTVNIRTFMCVNTVDIKINNLVYKKGDLSDMLVDGLIKPGFERMMIQYLVS
jgi:SNF2 family DNA or RNA helicase